MDIHIYIRVYIYEPLSKSIADVWYENIGYRFLGGYRFTVFYQINTKECKNSAESRIQISKLPGMG